MSQLFQKITDQYSKELPFVCFRKPQEGMLKAYFCTSQEVNYSDSFGEEGFVFAPFDQKEKAVVFPLSLSEVFEEKIDDLNIENSSATYKTLFSDESAHLQLIEEGINAIDKGEFKKVVLSRKEVLELSDLQMISVYHRLLKEYQNAFVYIWFHPKVGLWMGATPERLVSLKENQFVTMALAGTQVFDGNENPIWGQKEQKEHQYVVDYIVSQIQDPTNGIILEGFNVSETYTSKAGNLLHLKADIKGEIGGFNLKQLLQTLHPTPAVCGLPKKEAQSFILENENYSRSFYTGFLGEMNVNSKTELFVNLRCVEFENQQAHIYIGGGITSESNPQKEWEETIAKTKTIKKAL